MPIYQIQYNFSIRKRGFSETYWRDGNDARAIAASIRVNFIDGLRSLRAVGWTLDNARISRWRGAVRDSFLQQINLPCGGFGGVPYNDWRSDQRTTAVAIAMHGEAAHETRLFKALPDTAVQYTISGIPIATGPTNEFIAMLRQELPANSLSLRYLIPPTGPNPDRHVVEIRRFGTSTSLAEVRHSGPQIPSLSWVVCHRLPKGALPGWKREQKVIASPDANTFVVPYEWPARLTSVDGKIASCRIAEYLLTPFRDAFFVDYRSRKTGRPTGVPAGRIRRT